MIDPRHVGSSFDDFLEEEGIRQEVDRIAVKRVLAWQLREAMKTQKMSKAEIARAMATSRAQVDRILDPENRNVRLDTLDKAARALGREIRITLV